MNTQSHRVRRFRAGHYASGCAVLALMTGLPAVALAQAAPSQEPVTTVDEIVVTGLRASLARAIDVKRNADTIVDSIASEDLGKFPDYNVAESLQRITGVSIDRSGGEGQFVTVRGFGPQFNTVLVNGRTIATENPGRQFSFDLLAAELISGADVYKSSSAILQDGGIGSTINVKSARPFDIDGQRLIVSGKANYEDLSEETAGDVFGLYSNTFADGRFGALLAVSYQQRKARIDQVATNGYYRTNVPGFANVLVPQNFDQIVDQQERTRLGVNGTLQYRASDRLLLTLDGLYNKFEVESDASSVGHFFSPSAFSNVTIDGNRTVTAFTQDISGHTDYITRTFNRPTEVKALGLNADWDLTDMINVKFDSSWSEATSDNGGNEVFSVIGFNNVVRWDNTAGGLPSIIPTSSVVNPNAGRAHFATREGLDVSETVYENKVDVTFLTDNDTFTALKVGAFYQDRTKENALIRSEANVGCSYCGYAIPVPASLLTTFDPGNFLGGQAGNFPRAWLTFDAEEYFAFLESRAAADAQDRAVGRPVGTLAAFLAQNNGYDAIRYPDSYEIQEKIAAGYAQADFRSTIGGLEWSGNVGVRYVHTDVESNGAQQTLLDILTIPGDSTAFTTVFAPGATPVTRESSYNDFLPSLNVKVQLTEDMVARFASSRTVTRPNVTLLAPRVNFTSVRPGNLEASGGNPDLEPYKSTNFDGSFEWYYQPAGYFTVAAFYKRVENFIVSQVATEQFTVANASGIFPGGVANFQVRRPRNLEEADVYGLEIGFQHTFDYLPAPFDGLGVTANATFVESSTGAAVNNGTSFALEGLGNSQNLVLFYEKGPIEARIAYNHRDEFIQTLANGTGGDPVFVKPESQIDLQARYAINDNISVFFEGVNVTDEKTEKVGLYENQFLNLTVTGARYAVGARFQF